MKRFICFLFMPFILILSTQAQDPRTLTGSYMGAIKLQGSELRIYLKIWINERDSLEAIFMSPDQGVERIPIDEISFSDGNYLMKAKSIRSYFKGRPDADGAFIRGNWNQSFQSLPLDFERVEQLPSMRKPQTPEAPYPYLSEDIAVDNPVARVRLSGTLTLPEGNGPFPAVVLISGSGPQDRDESILGHKPFAVIADHLSRHGFAVLRYDDRGVGASTGQFATATSYDLADDAEALFNHLRRHPKIDSMRVGLAGHSEGSMLAGIVGSRNPGVAFIISLAGAGVTGEQIILDQTRLISLAQGMKEEEVDRDLEVTRKIYRIAKTEKNPDKAFSRIKKIYQKDYARRLKEGKEQAQVPEAAIDQTVKQILSPWFLTFLVFDPAEYYGKVAVPVLLLNGEKDLQVPAEANLEGLKNALDVAGNKNVSIHLMKGMNHLFQTCTTGLPTEYARIEETFSPEVLEIMLTWLNQVTRNSPK